MDKFANIQKIGEGGFGEVYKATDKMTGKSCALKRIKEIDQAALVEVEALQQVRGHPNIANIQSYFISRGSLWVVTGFCEAGDLNRYYWDKKPDVNTRFQFMKQMASAVAFLHNKGVAHRDLKPENVLIGYDESQQPQTQLTDFGIAKIHCGEQMTQQFMTTCAGTAFFIAPEVLSSAEGGQYTVKADVFSLGVIFRALVFEGSLRCGENTMYLVACFMVDGNPVPYSQAMVSNKDLEIKVRKDVISSSSARQLMDGMLLRNESLRLSAKAVDAALTGMSAADFHQKTASASQQSTAPSESPLPGQQPGGQLLSRLTQTVRTVKPKSQQSQGMSAARELSDALLLFSKEDLMALKHQILFLFVTLSRNAPPAQKHNLQQWVVPVVEGIDKVLQGERLGDTEAARFAVGWLQFQSTLNS